MWQGWQPGIQEGAADWNEEWDRFEDEGIYIYLSAASLVTYICQ